jgi:hypothetical protein
MTTLTILNDAALRIGLPQMAAAVGSTDPTALQLVALLQEELNYLINAHQWTILDQEATFSTIPTEYQGEIATIAPGLRFILNNTIWNRDLRRPVFGPLSPQKWQELEAMQLKGPWNQFRIRGGKLYFLPAPATGHACYFEYAGSYPVIAAADSSYKARVTLDTDTFVFNEEVLTLGLIWRFKGQKGFDYSEDRDKYNRLLLDEVARDGSKPTLNLVGGTGHELVPGIMVPTGSWGLSNGAE